MSDSDCSSSDNKQDAPQQDTGSKTPPSASSKAHRPGSSAEPQFQLPSSDNTQQTLNQHRPCSGLSRFSAGSTSLIFSANHHGALSRCATHRCARWRGTPTLSLSHSLPSTSGS
ncbi:hypothetical protein Q8A67_022821 [Cirrhinus molitorella]|uniref:Uncharacterized protein n=1 Tax=Cirrhinus molitorella TaxID=172907 RepID=A0AA88PAA9_9TELE|nr:hypothetical protein Q8A67_022821 [Cirrhinus molitorella]